MKDDGFMMIDSVLTMLVFSIIISVLVPAMIMLEQTLSDSVRMLEFNRRLYINMLAYDDFESFRQKSREYLVEDHRICDRDDAKLCVQLE